jgi:hypothetical protein
MTEWIGARVDTVGGWKEGKKERRKEGKKEQRRSKEGINAEDAETQRSRRRGTQDPPFA